ncbi:hypothetical protein GCM10011332_05920 [Terasakiella brassicae]|uniref:MotA/TolQ/ExbB proton channel domain-containing protein n=1 Tax=Terasakiella brassicae TaxID=1634917 RepID=A0A917F9E6_9PROT|nr:hypothetical protein GCM10011332_05920 [Terasakiella brassicae]
MTLRLEVKNLFDAFQQLENSGNQVDPSILSGGIWLALLTTGVGLAVATRTVAINSFFEHRLERAQPLPKFPTEMKEDKLHLTLPIQFALR